MLSKKHLGFQVLLNNKKAKRRLFQLSITVCSILLVVSCTCDQKKPVNYPYPQKVTISSPTGKTFNSLIAYFPDSVFYDSVYKAVQLDKFAEDEFSAILFAAKEPILHNYYLGKPVYRLVRNGGLIQPHVFTFYEKNRRYWMTTKMLDHIPEVLNELVKSISPNDIKLDSIIKRDIKANLLVNKTKELTIKEWAEFKRLILTLDPNELQPVYQSAIGYSGRCDNSFPFFEIHESNRYRFIKASKEIAEFIYEKSNNETLIRYH